MNTQKQANIGKECGRYLRLAAILIVVLASVASANADDPFGLGDAGVQNFAVLNLSDQFILNGNGGAVNGNVGVSSADGGSYNITSPANINGQLITNSGVTGTSAGVPITGGTSVNNTLINSAVTNAHTASVTNGGLAATTSVAGGQITGDTTITGHAGQNVVNLTNVNTNGNKITLNAPAGSTFVINDSGDFVLKHTQIDLTGGLTANDVLYNITDASGNVFLTGGGVNDTQLNGILLADGNDVHLAPITLNGEVIGNQINLSSGTQVNDPYTVRAPVVPEPSSVVPMVMGIALLGMIVVARKQQRYGFGPTH